MLLYKKLFNKYVDMYMQQYVHVHWQYNPVMQHWK